MSSKAHAPSQISKFRPNKKRSFQNSPKSDDTSSSKSSFDKNRTALLPIPKGDNPYAMAKTSEYKYRDLDSAEAYYLQAIRQGDRAESAVKDLASLLHQRGKTKEACEILEKHKELFSKDKEKFINLYNTLRKQIDSTGNCQNKTLKMSNLQEDVTAEHVTSLFTNSIRIQKVSLDSEEVDGKQIRFALLYFNSHSSARKTLEGFHSWDRYRVEWISPIGEVLGDAHYARHKMEEYRKHHPTFDYVVFDRDPHGYVFSLPLDISGYSYRLVQENEKNAEKLLGSDLYSIIFEEEILKV